MCEKMAFGWLPAEVQLCSGSGARTLSYSYRFGLFSSGGASERSILVGAHDESERVPKPRERKAPSARRARVTDVAVAQAARRGACTDTASIASSECSVRSAALQMHVGCSCRWTRSNESRRSSRSGQ